MDWVYLSPHLDDVPYSCGGLLWEQRQRGDSVSVWTVCAGMPPAGELSEFAQGLHQRWGTGLDAIGLRRDEDRCACEVLGVQTAHLDLPDCIYRKDSATGEALYASEEDIFGPVHPVEAPLVEELSREYARRLPADAMIVAPLSIGGHVDHRLVVRLAYHLLGTGLWQVWFYADFPYIKMASDQVDLLERHGWSHVQHEVSDGGLAAWVRAAGCYRSQLSTFWADELEMEADFRAYARKMGGVCLWQPTEM